MKKGFNNKGLRLKRATLYGFIIQAMEDVWGQWEWPKKQERGGYAAQKRLAVTIAQAELAKQIEVLVNSEVQTEKIVIDTKTDQHYRAKLSSLTTQETWQLIKNAVVKDEWVDPKTENLYLWVVIDEVNP